MNSKTNEKAFRKPGEAGRGKNRGTAKIREDGYDWAISRDGGHDLRNPLTSIAGAVYYLKKKAGPKLNEKEKEMIAKSRNQWIILTK